MGAPQRLAGLMLLAPFTNIGHSFHPKKKKKPFTIEQFPRGNYRQTVILYEIILVNALTLLSFMRGTVSFFFSCPHAVFLLYSSPKPPPHSVFVPPQPHTPSYALVCVSLCVFSYFTRIFVVLLPWRLGLLN